MTMSDNNVEKTPDLRIPGTRQAGGIVPAPSRSEARPESCEGPSGELSASPPLDRAIAGIIEREEREGERAHGIDTIQPEWSEPTQW